MYNDDNNGKYALLAALFAMLLFTLASCGKQMAELRGSAHDIAFRLYAQAGVDTGRMSEEELSEESSYMLGISEESFRKNVDEARFFRPEELSAAQSLCVVVAKSTPCAEAVYAEMKESYDWVPCEPASTAVFMIYGNCILLAKSDEAGARALSAAFDGETRGGARSDFSSNPMSGI